MREREQDGKEGGKKGQTGSDFNTVPKVYLSITIFIDNVFTTES